jgi:hypothetical protein
MAIMLRRLFALTSALSLVLLIGACVTWAASYGFAYEVEFVPKTREDIRFGETKLWDETSIGPTFNLVNNQSHHLTIRRGRVRYERIWYFRDGIAGWRQEISRIPSYILYDNGEVRKRVTIPLWLISGIIAVVPVSHVIAHRLQQRCHHGRICSKCGYDMRASPDRCPECGSIARNEKRSAEPNHHFAK